MCLWRSLFHDALCSHWGHWNFWPSWTDFICFLRSYIFTDLYSQCEHWCFWPTIITSDLIILFESTENLKAKQCSLSTEMNSFHHHKYYRAGCCSFFVVVRISNTIIKLKLIHIFIGKSVWGNHFLSLCNIISIMDRKW